MNGWFIIISELVEFSIYNIFYSIYSWQGLQNWLISAIPLHNNKNVNKQLIMSVNWEICLFCWLVAIPKENRECVQRECVPRAKWSTIRCWRRWRQPSRILMKMNNRYAIWCHSKLLQCEDEIYIILIVMFYIRMKCYYTVIRPFIPSSALVLFIPLQYTLMPLGVYFLRILTGWVTETKHQAGEKRWI